MSSASDGFSDGLVEDSKEVKGLMDVSYFFSLKEIATVLL
ncbi:hypothetical protein EV13_1449 [Prochlorococcus sp. MIT 0702]|nr:hypothetical protein EV12_0609 [Prochlorococcus sp. MIT 0701]KGG28935.1 hypothetical protein EV13_1449 [Prochlorococcus sp. MIT 0702]KGG37133.1 hypothetical protein EV14_0075 [Prochlorococcus sp. MIT 0703]